MGGCMTYKIETVEQNDKALKIIDKFMGLPVDSTSGKRLLKLVDAVVVFEKEHYGF